MRVSPGRIADTMLVLLQGHLRSQAAPTFWVWAREDRAIVGVNPNNLRDIHQVTSERFAHAISTSLGGCRVVRANSRGVFFQIAYTTRPPVRLDFRPLELAEQPGPWHIPFGTTAAGPLWLDVPAETHGIIVAGAPRFGKTRMIHGFIQALLNGGKTSIYLWDGKGGLEFSRYAAYPGAIVISDLTAGLNCLQGEIDRRRELFLQIGAVDLPEYNRRAQEPLPLLALVTDEFAMIPQEHHAQLHQLAAKGAAYGLYPIFGTQRTSGGEVPAAIKATLPTRVCFAVPAVQDSMVALGFGGAEKLPKKPGRFLVRYGSRTVTGHAFQVELPEAGGAVMEREDRELAERALGESYGVLSIPLLMNWGLSEWRARKLLEAWELRGWVERDPERSNARVVVPAIARLISQTPQASQTPQSGSQAPQIPESEEVNPEA